MTSRDFCYWLQGYLEIQAARPQPANGVGLTAEQVAVIQAHLAMVFVHEIDPQFPNAVKLNTLHHGLPPAGPPKDAIARC